MHGLSCMTALRSRRKTAGDDGIALIKMEAN